MGWLNIARIKGDIAAITTRPKGVGFEEIVRIANQLNSVGYAVHIRKGKEAVLFNISGHRFGVCPTLEGSTSRPCTVKEFLRVMAILDLLWGMK